MQIDVVPELQGEIAEALIQKQQKHNRLVKLASVFARTNSVLTSKRISVNVVDMPHQHAPAWSSTTDVWLNSAVCSDLNAQSILSLQGLDFHELAHLLYTPRNSHLLVKQVQDEKLWEAFNCLEDSRIENLLVGYLPSIKSWLTATIADYLMGDEQAIKTAYPLVVGRKYLPAEMQQLAVDNYSQVDDIDELADILDEYNQLLFVDNSNNETAIKLIRRFSELLKNLPPLPQQGNGTDGEGNQIIEVIYRVKNPNGHNNRPTEGYESSSNRPKSKSQQERDMGNANQQNKNKPRPKPTKRIYVDVETEQDIPAPTSQPSNSNQDSNNELDTDSQDKNNNLDPSDEGGEGWSDEGGDTGTNEQVTDTLKDVMQDVLKELSKEVNQIAKQLGIDVGLDGGNADTPKRAKYTEKLVPAELFAVATSFGKELERLRANYEPAWETQVDTGRLNVNRYLNNEDFDTCFDEWQEGKSDVCAIEAVILLDKSGSMQGANADNAYKAMWAIKKSLENVNATTSVVLFDSYTHLLYDKGENAGTTIRDSGADYGTDPADSLLYAKRILAETDKPIKLLFMITDGAWDTDEGEQAIKEMRNAGVLTCQAILTPFNDVDYLNQNRHSFEILTTMQSAKDILSLGKELVRLAITRNLA